MYRIPVIQYFISGTEAFSSNNQNASGLSTSSKIKILNLRVLDTYLPLLLLNQDDWRDRINKLMVNIEAFDGVISHLEKALRDEPDLELQYRLSIESIKLIQSISGERSSPLLSNATGGSSSQFIQYIHDLIPRVESGFKRRNDLVILIATLLSSAVILKQAANNQPCDEALSNLMQNTEALINFHENQPEWVIKHLHDGIYKYQCIYQKLMGKEINNYSLLFGLEPASADSHDLMHYQYGFANEKIGTMNVERAFDISAFKSGQVFQAGLNETYVAKFAYRTERKHWQEALDKIISAKGPMSQKDLKKITYLLNHDESPDLAVALCKKLFMATNFSTSEYAIPLYQRCIRSFPHLLDDLYVMASDYPRQNGQLINFLKTLGSPSPAIMGQLSPELKKMKLQMDIGMDI